MEKYIFVKMNFFPFLTITKVHFEFDFDFCLKFLIGIMLKIFISFNVICCNSTQIKLLCEICYVNTKNWLRPVLSMLSVLLTRLGLTPVTDHWKGPPQLRLY